MRILFVATVVKTHIMEFHLPYLQMCKEMGWETAVAARNDYENPEDCQIPNCDQFYDVPFERSPFKPKNFQAYRELKRIINEGHYNLIHCHTPVGAMLTRLAAGRARKNGSKVIYTAHGFHFFQGAPLVNWLVYYPVEKILARTTDVLILMNHEDYQRAWKFAVKRVEYVPGVGIDTAKFAGREETAAKTRSRELRDEYGIPTEGKILLSVGEVNQNKNHRIVIELLPKLEKTWYIICGHGPLMETYRQLAKDLNVSERLIMTGYRKDVPDFYRLADLFVFPSFREGLPVSVMEAMAAGLPVVCSRIRGNVDLITEEKGGSFFEPANPIELLPALQKLLINSTLAEEYGKYNQKEVEKYSQEQAVQKVKVIYLSEI